MNQMMDEKSDLTLVPTEKILDELRQRFDSFIFFAINEIEHKKGLDGHSQVTYNGHPIFCLGMTNMLKDCILDDIRKNSEHFDQFGGDIPPEV